MPTAARLALVLGALALAAGATARATRDQGVTTLDPRRVALNAPSWAPPVWEEWIAARIAESGPLSTLDRTELETLVREVEAMPQVVAVHDWRVIWPDGLALDLELRRPVACVRSGVDFIAVAGDGVLLPGYWSAPPEMGFGPLPLIGPLDGAFDAWVPGDRLREPRHLDALSVALSLEAHLERGLRREIGPLRIDVDEEAQAGVSEPVIRLLMPERRLALFGRAPRAGAPGELPEESKWLHLAAAYERLESEKGFDWDLIDLRWDRAPLRPRGPQ